MPFKKLFLTGAALLALGAFATNGFAAQNQSSASSDKGQNKQSAQDNDSVQRVLASAEQQYRIGLQQLNNGDCASARAAFDKAVDILLEADSDIRKDARFRTYYADLIDRIYKNQLLAMQNGNEGFTQQSYDINEASPLDELSKIDLDAEGVSSTGTVEVKGFDFQFTPNPAVVQFINYFTQGRGRSTMENGLRRSGRYRAMVEQIFKEEGVPHDIMWLAQVESVWVPHALSYAAAKGLWQFIPSTGSRYGLQQSAWVDERVSPERSTRAAARYLKFLNEYFVGDWLLAMAAYNCGENGVDRAIARCGYADFWELYSRNLLPEQTRNYVPAILAVMIIAKDPQKYGFDVQPEGAWDYDSYELNSQVDVRVVASLLGVPVDTVRELNPELKRGITPPEGFILRLPKNSRDQFDAAFSNMEPSQYMLAQMREVKASRSSARYRTQSVKAGRRNYKVKNATVKSIYKKAKKSKRGHR